MTERRGGGGGWVFFFLGRCRACAGGKQGWRPSSGSPGGRRRPVGRAGTPTAGQRRWPCRRCRRRPAAAPVGVLAAACRAVLFGHRPSALAVDHAPPRADVLCLAFGVAGGGLRDGRWRLGRGCGRVRRARSRVARLPFRCAVHTAAAATASTSRGGRRARPSARLCGARGPCRCRRPRARWGVRSPARVFFCCCCLGACGQHG